MADGNTRIKECQAILSSSALRSTNHRDITTMAIGRVDTQCQRKVDAAAEIENRTRQISSAAAALFARHLSHLSSNALLVEIIFVPPIPSGARVHCSESDGESFAI